MKNQVIEVLNREHGMKVIEYWKSKGVDTMGMCGSFNKEDSGTVCYYGVINDMFDCFTIEDVRKYNAEIIELPKEENSFPRVMLVGDDGNAWHKRVVFMKKCDRYLAWCRSETIEESGSIYETNSWRYAKEIEPKEFTITLSDINSKIEDIKKLFGISEKYKLVIKVD